MDCKQIDSTGICKKNSFAYKLFANVTMKSSEKLVQSFKKMNHHNWQMEESKLELQRQVFNYSMQYTHNRDM